MEPMEPLRSHTAAIVTAYIRRNPIEPGDLAALIDSVHTALAQAAATSTPDPAPTTEQEPAVPIADSVAVDRIVCLECGKRVQRLARHLTAGHRLTPADYRRRWGLPPDYRMNTVYSLLRSRRGGQQGWLQ